VQEWKVPKPLAIILIAFLVLVIGIAVSMIGYETVRALRRFLQHRATTPSWVSSERPGLLDYEADGIRASKRFTRELSNLSDGTAELEKKIKRHTKRMEGLANKSGKAKQRRANRTAKDMDESAVYIEDRLDLLKAVVDDIFRNYSGLVSSISLDSDEDVRSAREFQTILYSGQEEAGQAVASVIDYRDSVRDLERQNVSRTVRIASRRLGDALDGIAVVLKQYQSRAKSLGRDFERKLNG
jgi:hypothetical protein